MDGLPTQIGRFRVIRQLGEGSSGFVYHVRDESDTDFALKVLRPSLASDERVRERLRREGIALQRVGGERTARIFEVHAYETEPYLVMELVPGETLDRFVESDGPLRGGLLWSFAIGLVDALKEIHGAGITHRDLKPSNIMIGPSGVKVLDFGISILHEVAGVTGTGTFLGTASWVSPEQVRGDSVSHESDIFSFGLVLAFAASGVHPFGSGRIDAVMYRISHEQPNLDAVPRSYLSLIEACLNKDPELRPSLSELSNSLRDVKQLSSDGRVAGDSGTIAFSQTAIENSISSGSMQQESQLLADTTSGSDSENWSGKKILSALAAIAFLVGAALRINAMNESSDSAIDLPEIEAEVSSTTSLAPNEVLLRNFDSRFENELNVAYEVYTSDEFERRLSFRKRLRSISDERGEIWGSQLDCNGYYPLADLGFADSSRTLVSGLLTNWDGQGGYLLSYRVFTGFKGDPMNFTRRVSLAEERFSGCNDTDFYPSNTTKVNDCMSDMFEDSLFLFPILDDRCAKRELSQWQSNPTGRSKKLGFYGDTDIAPHGRTGAMYVLRAEPTQLHRCCASIQWASVVVWEAEDLGIVVSSSGFVPKDKKVSWDVLDNSAVIAMFSALSVMNAFVVESQGK